MLSEVVHMSLAICVVLRDLQSRGTEVDAHKKSSNSGILWDNGPCPMGAAERGCAGQVGRVAGWGWLRGLAAT